MTKALEEVFRRVSRLPEAEQDALAEAIKAEIGAENDWDQSFAGSLDVLDRLADEAIADHRAGRTKAEQHYGEDDSREGAHRSDRRDRPRAPQDTGRAGWCTAGETAEVSHR